MTLKCPKCNSRDITLVVSGSMTYRQNPDTLEEEICEFNDTATESFECNDCRHIGGQSEHMEWIEK